MHPIENIMQTSMEQIKRMVDVNTVVGNPIVTAGNTMILPVSKLSLAFLVGGGEYGHMCSAKKAADEANRDSRFPFAGTSAVGMCTRRWHLSPRNREMFVLCLPTERARQTGLWT